MYFSTDAQRVRLAVFRLSDAKSAEFLVGLGQVPHPEHGVWDLLQIRHIDARFAQLQPFSPVKTPFTAVFSISQKPHR
ncbi:MULTISPECIES: hypothetical protein [unclassified Caballeronia]|uniref:hypothetical protein n=1 Tax=unclassified Caballeronia TaxID=2646786 RepID=UPI00202877C3|nr:MULTISPECIES: hypothetical protein [unclassified Caballeronia]